MRCTSVSIALFLNEQEVRVSPARRSRFATPAVCTEQHLMEAHPPVTKLPHAADAYDVELQRAPELERR